MVSGSKDNSIRLWGADDEGLWRCVGSGVGHAGNVRTRGQLDSIPRTGVFLIDSAALPHPRPVWALGGCGGAAKPRLGRH